MNLFTEIQRKANGEDFSQLVAMRNILKKQRSEMESLRNLVISTELPNETQNNEQVTIFQTSRRLLLVEIDYWLLNDDKIQRFIKEYEIKKPSISNATVAIWSIIEQKRSLKRFRKLEKDFVFISNTQNEKLYKKLNQEKISSIITLAKRYKWLKLTEIFFSAKTQNEVFMQTMADWDKEIYEALKKNKGANLHMIGVRNSYRFIKTIILESFIGELFEFIQKIKKG